VTATSFVKLTAGVIVPANLAVLYAQSKQALVGIGWKAAIAESATAAALAALGPTVPLERLIFEALRRCPRPTA
jgi:hypothetical protein